MSATQNGQAKAIDGGLTVPPGARFAIIASRFNSFIVEQLVDGALDALLRHGGSAENVTIIRVPGSREIPMVLRRVARSKKVDAIIVASAVIRGGTAHFDYVAGEVSRGVGDVCMETGIPATFGVLTTDTIEQAIERAGTKAGNKGADAAIAAIEMLNLGRALDAEGL